MHESMNMEPITHSRIAAICHKAGTSRTIFRKILQTCRMIEQEPIGCNAVVTGSSAYKAACAFAVARGGTTEMRGGKGLGKGLNSRGKPSRNLSPPISPPSLTSNTSPGRPGA